MLQITKKLKLWQDISLKKKPIQGVHQARIMSFFLVNKLCKIQTIYVHYYMYCFILTLFKEYYFFYLPLLPVE